MKIAYKHLSKFIPSKPSISDISEKLFQLGHEHELIGNFFDIEFTPNRGDCLSLKGILRDLAVFYEVDINQKIYEGQINNLDINFTNNASKACPYISFLKIDIENEISEYKGMLKDYFDDTDVNKNNFFTDISNYISYETGQPTHCYDANKFNNSLSLGYINDEKEFETLLDKNIQLTGKNLVFFQDDNVINLAGIMGGKETSCSLSTRSVIVECAWFRPEDVIGKSVKYDLFSESAHKFERGVDPSCHEYVLRRFIELVQNHSKVKSIQYVNYDSREFTSYVIDTNVNNINKILGTSLNKNQFEDWLSKLGFSFKDSKIIVPSYRNDVQSENDIAEEIARVYGYNNIPSNPINIPFSNPVIQKYPNLSAIKQLLIKNGFFEVINNPFIGNRDESSIIVDNPLDSNRAYLRTSLENSLVSNLLYNERRQKDSVKLFEISDVYTYSNQLKSKKIRNNLQWPCWKRLYQFFKKNDTNYLTNILKTISHEKDFVPTEISRTTLDTKIKNKIIYIELDLNILTPLR